MDEGKVVWVADDLEGYVKSKIKDLKSDGVCVEVISNRNLIFASFDEVFPCEEDEQAVDDNCSLMFLNRATLLNNLRIRYLSDHIYTYVANTLIAINPYKALKNLYDKKHISSYKGKSLGTLPPHVFAIADKAYREMKLLQESQSIVVSGESGAGKTESTKYILKYLTDSWGFEAGPIEQRIVESNPLLEAFGNAKTIRNNNSSRFGKFVEIHFDSKHQVCGGYISHYLLEKSRVSRQGGQERNFHIFYRLCSGAPEKLRQTLKVENPDDFHYLRNSCTQYFCSPSNQQKLSLSQKSAMTQRAGCLRDITIDDVSDFQLTDQAMTHMGLSDRLKIEIYRVIAGILHLGNIFFEDPPAEDTSGGCQVTNSSSQSLEITAILLGCDKGQLKDALISKLMVTNLGNRRGSTILVPLKTLEAQNARNALAKAIYTKLFDFIVSSVNRSLPFDQSSNYIGLLDIAGFEYFQENSFEQFCINYCNEKLQQFFNERILKEEQALYEREDLKVKKISYVDNQDCIDLIEAKGTGIFSILDEESKLPKPGSCHFTSEVHKLNKDHERLSIPRKSKLKSHREIREDEGFLVKHFAGAVCYQTNQFVEKNNDALHSSLQNLVIASKSSFLQSLFSTTTQNPTPNTNVLRSSSTSKLAFVSVGSKFQSQLSLLMEKLKSTGTSFIRCIKPNSVMREGVFEGNQVLNQLQCSGMPSVLDLMHQGFPSRTPFLQLYNRYHPIMPPNIAALDSRLFCKALFKALGLQDNDYKFGMTRIFFRPGKFAEFDQLLRSDPEHLKSLVALVQKWLLGMRWRRAQYTTLVCLRVKNIIEDRKRKMMRIQCCLRTWREKKKYLHRIKCLAKIRSLFLQLTPMQEMTPQLQTGQHQALADVEKVKSQIDAAIEKLKKEDKISEKKCEEMYEEIWRGMEVTLGNLRKMVEEEKVRKEEEEKMKKIQEEMEKKKEEEERLKRKKEEKRVKEEKERKMKEAEETKKREEIEERRKMEEETRKQEEARLEELRILRAQEEIERDIRCQREEQERKDRELALRVASEDVTKVEDPSRYDYSLPKRQTIKKIPGQRILPLPSENFLSLSPNPSPKSSPSHQPPQQPASQQQQQMKTLYEQQKRLSFNNNSNNLTSHFDPLKRGIDMSNFSAKPGNIGEWSYADLRDTINTSCDMNLLEKCRQEIHRRLLVYHDWKVKNRDESTTQRAPESLLNKSRNPYLLDHLIPFEASSLQRFFRVPLDSRGWWLVHFDGNWVARQMHLFPSKPPLLLVAGQDDMNMFEYNLKQSGLPRENGVEITEGEFEQVWCNNGGDVYLRNVGNKTSSRYLRTKMGLHP